MQLNKISLHKTATKVNFTNPDALLAISDDMLALMRTKGGIGLAATQCGLTKRIFVMEIDGVTYRCFNPSIIEQQGPPVQEKEGCLSYPGQFIPINRSESILVEYSDHTGQWKHEWLSGLTARCFQHELDHLNGITMIKRQNL